uniref:ArfGAP with FG repeats 2 n=1 Tax=Oryctolagus cuniculus TaxID=9986 RepID=A0A5F9C290_RABIT
MVMAAKKGPGPGGGVGAGKAEAEAASEVWCRRVRELGGCSQAGNRHCFECAQRGVTYVDITVGSFVCTTCSGLLRGLNPPHRVKSISMTTFTEPEVLFLQSRGNEVCRKIWLGLFDARTSLIPDSRDPQKVKEFLQEKYEKKRWYVPPDQVKGPTYTKGSASTPVQGSGPEGKPPRSLLGDPVPSLSAAASTSSQSVSQSQARTAQARSSQLPAHSAVKKATTDLLADIGGDPFAAPQAAPAFAPFPAFGGHTPSPGGFANFDAFGSSPGAAVFGSVPPAGQAPFPAQPTPAASRMLTGSFSFGSSQVTPFGTTPLAPASQPNSLAEVGSLLGPGASAGGVPGRPHQPIRRPCRPAPAAFHQPVPVQWPGPRARLWDEQCGAWLPADCATCRDLCQPLPSPAVPPTELAGPAGEWHFLWGLGISQAGAEAPEPASWDLHQSLHDWILTKPICHQTSNHQPILVALCPWRGPLPAFQAPPAP